MRRALAKLLPEDHRSVEKQSCKRQDNNGRPKYQNVCISSWSAAFVFDSVLAIERAVYCRSEWVILSCLGGSFSCHSIIRKWQREVLAIWRRLALRRLRQLRAREGSIVSRSLLRSAKFLVQNCAIWRNATKITLASLPCEKHATQDCERLRKPFSLNYKSAALTS